MRGRRRSAASLGCTDQCPCRHIIESRMPQRAIRFAVREGDCRSATWKLWTESGVGKSDLYLVCRSLGGSLKTSLHESGRWHVAYSKETFEEKVKGMPRLAAKPFHRTVASTERIVSRNYAGLSTRHSIERNRFARWEGRWSGNMAAECRCRRGYRNRHYSRVEERRRRRVAR